MLYFVAFGVKLVPFHFWLPSVYGSAPPAVAAVLAGALANIGADGLLRFQAGLLSREVVAYSAIGHAGYVLVALGLGGRVA